MKYNILFYCLFLSVTLFVTSCGKDDDVVTVEYPTQQEIERVDPVVLMYTPVVSFVAGEESYDISYHAWLPSGTNTTKLNIYSTYTDSGSGESSNEVLLTSYDLSSGENPLGETLTYEKLKEGLTVNGGALPVDQVDIPVGSIWNLRFEPVDGSGKETFSAPGIKIAVLSPFAGLYTVIESSYFRIGVNNGGWNGVDRFIGSVDENTFSHDDSWGPFDASGAFYFDLNDDNSITVIDDNALQLFFSGNDMLTCQEDGAIFTNVPCDGSNVLIPKTDGKHIIKLTYGYFTNGSGAREFYEVLEKKL